MYWHNFINSSFWELLLVLFAVHALCDYPLQGDFLAKGKNHRLPLPGIPWYQCLFAHVLIHGGFVYIVTGFFWLGIAELLIHAVTDYSKSEGWISFNTDQAIHYACKLLWACLAMML